MTRQAGHPGMRPGILRATGSPGPRDQETGDRQYAKAGTDQPGVEPAETASEHRQHAEDRRADPVIQRKPLAQPE